MKISIRLRIILAFVALALTPVLISTVAFVMQSQQKELDALVAYNTEKVGRIGAQIESILHFNSSYLETGLRLGGFAQLDDRGRTALLERLLARRDAIRSVSFIDSSAKVSILRSNTGLINASKETDHSNDPGFRIPMDTGTTYFSPVYYDHDSNEPMVSIAVSVQSHDNIAERIGVVTARIRLKPIWNMLASLELNAGEDIYVIDDQQRVVAHQNPSVVLSEKRVALDRNQIRQKGLGGNDALTTFYAIRFNQQQFTVVSEMDYRIAMQPIFDALLIRIVIMIGAFLGALILFYWLAGTILGPIESVAAAARAIREGDWTQRVAAGNDDEVGEMAKAFNTMTDRMTTMLKALQKEALERTAAQAALHELNENLNERVTEELNKNREKDAILIKQDRLARMGEMLTMISHHWRQPLNIINLSIQNLQDLYDHGEMGEKELNDTATTIMKYTDELSMTLLSLSTLTAKPTADLPFDLSKATQTICDLIRAEFSDNYIEFSCELQEGVEIVGTPPFFSQIFTQILKNAEEAVMQHSRDERHILVRLSHQGGGVALSVEDSGGGIDPAAMPRLFEPFFTTKGITSKTGLGLYVVKSLMEQQFHGSIKAENHAKGARFTLIFPESIAPLKTKKEPHVQA